MSKVAAPTRSWVESFLLPVIQILTFILLAGSFSSLNISTLQAKAELINARVQHDQSNLQREQDCIISILQPLWLEWRALLQDMTRDHACIQCPERARALRDHWNIIMDGLLMPEETRVAFTTASATEIELAIKIQAKAALEHQKSRITNAAEQLRRSRAAASAMYEPGALVSCAGDSAH